MHQVDTRPLCIARVSCYSIGEHDSPSSTSTSVTVHHRLLPGHEYPSTKPKVPKKTDQQWRRPPPKNGGLGKPPPTTHSRYWQNGPRVDQQIKQPSPGPLHQAPALRSHHLRYPPCEPRRGRKVHDTKRRGQVALIDVGARSSVICVRALSTSPLQTPLLGYLNNRNLNEVRYFGRSPDREEAPVLPRYRVDVRSLRMNHAIPHRTGGQKHA
jgi:hypothetical protein